MPNLLPARRGGGVPERSLRVDIPADLRRALRGYPEFLKLLDQLLQLPRARRVTKALNLLLLLILLDDSGSIHQLGAEDLLCAGADAYIQAQRGATVVTVWRLNDVVPMLDARIRKGMEPGAVASFIAYGGTPMHDRFALALALQLVEYLFYSAHIEGVTGVRTMTVMVGDGEDDGRGSDAELCRIIMDYMRRNAHHGFQAKGCGKRRVFQHGFGAMGFRGGEIEVVSTMTQMQAAMQAAGQAQAALAIEQGVRELRSGQL
jgi:hypothetical protein